MEFICPKCGGANNPDVQECKWCQAVFVRVPSPPPQPAQEDWTEWSTKNCLVAWIGGVVVVSFYYWLFDDPGVRPAILLILLCLILIPVPLGILCWAFGNICKTFGGER